MKMLHRWQHKPDFRLGASMATKSQNKAAARGIVYHGKVYKKLATAQLDGKLLVEPWFFRIDDQPRKTMRSPDAVLLFDDSSAVVIEVKMNWKDGRDEKLLNEYLPIVKSAFNLECVWPLLITGCTRGYKHKPLLGLQQLHDCFAWEPGRPTPLMLML